MSISPITQAGPSGIAGAGSAAQFKNDLRQAPLPRGETSPLPINNPPLTHALPGKCTAEGVKATGMSPQVSAAHALERVNQAQTRMEQILHLAESGKSFSPAELISLQTHVYRASQELDLAGKVVEKATGGVKQILQTQV